MEQPDPSVDPVAKPAEPRVRPPSLTVALVLFGLFVAVRFNNVRKFTTEQYASGEISGLEMALQLGIIVALIALCLRLSKGDAWARWTLIPITAWLIYDLRWGLVEILGGGSGVSFGAEDVIVWLLPAVCTLATTIILFGPARSWFRR
jgi:hypothetical protein